MGLSGLCPGRGRLHHRPRLYHRLANLGQSRALLCLGEMCREGQGEPENFTQAHIYYERAARAGEAEGYRRIGLFHRYGHGGLERNWTTAQSWFQRALNAGYGPAAAEIGELYREGGPGIDRDYASAKEWFTRAVDLGHIWGLVELGTLYEKGGPGIESNYLTAKGLL